MIAGVDEASARAIVAHAENLQQAEKGAELSSVSAASQTATPAQFPSESGHWYDPSTGNQIELPPRTWTSTYIKRGYVPGVTTITKQAHKEAILMYEIKRAVRFSADVVYAGFNDYDASGGIEIDDAFLHDQVRQLMKADSDAIFGRGKELHTAIELFAQNKNFDLKWEKHIDAVIEETFTRGINLYKGNSEHSFATSRYGGKIDWHNDEWLLDFKTKPSIVDGKKLAYPEHAQQLAAYACGLSKGTIVDKYGYGIRSRKCANVFVGADDAKVVFHEWKEKDLLQGWREFECLLNLWWVRNGGGK